MSEPTNSDIMEKLGGIVQEVKEVRIQTTKTNGNVTRLKEWRIGIDIYMEQVLEKLKSPGTSPPSDLGSPQKNWFEDPFVRKLITSAGLLLTAVATFLAAGGVK